jgi:hypothetical protein
VQVTQEITIMTRFLRFVVAILALSGAQAQAAFHLWSMNELYSNADGTVQFIELVALSGGQEFLFGHSLSASGGGVTHTFPFPADLSGDTSGKTMLIATQGFAALGIVTPDYIVPNNFFFQGGGSVNFANVDIWTHPALPTDNRSLFRDGSTAVNSPRNFHGQQGTVPASGPAPGLNFQALWYKSPAESESGWGVNIAHQGDTFFVTWFTYDTDGSQMWLVGPAVRKTTGNTYTGDLFRTTGPAFNAVPFGAISFAQAGTVTFNFSDANNGTMSYTVGAVSQSKAITRQIFDVAPTCTAGGTPAATPNFSDLWYRSPAESESGWGLNIMQQGNILFVSWFTYDLAGRGMWVVGPRMVRSTGNTFVGDLFRTTGPAFSAQPWNPAGVTPIPFGNATISFTDSSNGTFNYNITGVTPNVQQTKNITRQSFGAPPTVCRN